MEVFIIKPKLHIKRYRIMNNASITELSQDSKLSVSYISLIEHEKEFPTIDAFSNLAKGLKVCPYQLVDFCSNCEFDECLNPDKKIGND